MATLIQETDNFTPTMFLFQDSKTWYEFISEGWQWIFGIATALVIIFRATRKTGETGKSFLATIKRFTDTAGAISELKTTIDTGFKEIKSEQAYINAKLEVLSDGHVTATFRADHQGNFVDVNEAFCQFFHKSLDELEGDGWTQIFNRDDREQSLAAWDRAISRKIPFNQVFRVICAGGITRTVKMRARPLFNGDGDFKEFVGSISLLKDDEEIHTTDNGSQFWRQRELPQKKK